MPEKRISDDAMKRHLARLGVLAKEAREKNGDKQQVVADAIGISRPALSQIEHGTYYGLPHPTLIMLFNFLKIPLSEIAEA